MHNSLALVSVALSLALANACTIALPVRGGLAAHRHNKRIEENALANPTAPRQQRASVPGSVVGWAVFGVAIDYAIAFVVFRQIIEMEGRH